MGKICFVFAILVGAVWIILHTSGIFKYNFLSILFPLIWYSISAFFNDC